MGSGAREREESGLRRRALRVGTDLCAVAQVEESISAFGDRYLQRIFTPHELAYAASSPALQSARLAARFAAKEATVKVLRPVDARPDWHSIEVRRDAGGWCEIVLTGTAQRLAAEQGVESLALSLSHDHGTATAVVVADVSEPR